MATGIVQVEINIEKDIIRNLRKLASLLWQFATSTQGPDGKLYSKTGLLAYKDWTLAKVVLHITLAEIRRLSALEAAEPGTGKYKELRFIKDAILRLERIESEINALDPLTHNYRAFSLQPPIIYNKNKASAIHAAFSKLWMEIHMLCVEFDKIEKMELRLG